MKIVERLRAAGHEALWAGGCVRDELLNRRPKDYDVATSAVPEQIQTLFGPKRSLMIGAAFGVVAVVGSAGEGMVEVTTFRRDATYSDGRHPDGVSFSTAEVDAQRRDFTINGLFFDPIDRRVIDYVGGVDDLRAGVVRAIGDAHQRLTEDKLRMLRAVRMAATFQFALEPATLAAIQRMAFEIWVVSPERIAQELRLLFELPTVVRGLELLETSGLLRAIFSELSTTPPHRLEHGVEIVAALPRRSFALVLAVLLSQCGTGESCDPPARLADVCRRLKLSNRESDHARWLVAHEQALVGACQQPWSRLQPLLIEPHAADLVDLHAARAEVDGQSSDDFEFCRSKLALEPDVLNPPPLLSGNDLAAHGIAAGKRVGELLRGLRAAQLDGYVATRSEALAWVDRQSLERR
ncbi:MAG TPA: CCA tRNA nucleotidyltransferase [Pirellulales bacterium]|nr:CCA tRNA nucleotidyltransferase [Pirellulales bacterium]